MKKCKMLWIAALMLAALICLTGCQSKEGQYKKAQNLISDGKLEEAIKILDELGSYEDSSKLSMYAKAIQAGESGEYDTALSTFASLSNFMDSEMMVTYYTGRKAEDSVYDGIWIYGDKWFEAIKIYESIPLFRDCKGRAENCRKAAYDQAVKSGDEGKTTFAISILKELGAYSDASKQVTYYEALALLNQGDYSGARTTFSTIPGFRDADSRAASVLEDGYNAAAEKEKVGELDEASAVFLNLGDYKDSAERAYKLYYDAGMARREAKDWTGARAAFAKAGEYSDAAEQISETTYLEASYLEATGNQESAYKLFVGLGEYKDSYERANKPYYDLGIKQREAQEWDLSVAAFEHAGGYSDAKEQITATRYAEGEYKRENGDWTGAREAFKNAGNYSDAKEQIAATWYAEGEYKRENGDWAGAREAFKNAGNYSDAAIRISATNYEEAAALEASGELEKAHQLFVDLKNYSDAPERAKKTSYALGTAYLEQQNWDKAVSAFQDAGDYSDAAEQILATYYARGIAERESGKWTEAISSFTTAGEYGDAVVQIQETKYLQTEALLEEGKNTQAYRIRQEIRDYKDTAELLEKDVRMQTERLREERTATFRKKGSVVIFGRYEQDNNKANGPEDITWIVLDVQGDKCLLISEMLLDCVKYHSTMDDYVTWKTCSLRKWLNSTFLNETFTIKEQAAILTTKVDNSLAQGYDGFKHYDAGITEDRVFVLSYAEANQYYNVINNSEITNRKAIAKPTEYALARGALTQSWAWETVGNSSWWLRSPGGRWDSLDKNRDGANVAATVSADGWLSSYFVDDDDTCIRPAIWIDLQSDYFIELQEDTKKRDEP